LHDALLAQVPELKNAIAIKDAWIDNSVKVTAAHVDEIKEWEEKYADAECKMEESDNKMEGLYMRIAEMYQRLEEKDAELANLRLESASLHHALALSNDASYHQEILAEQIQATTAHYEQELATLAEEKDTVISEKDAIIAYLHEVIAVKEDSLAGQADIADQQTEMIAEQNSIIEELHEESQQYRLAYEDAVADVRVGDDYIFEQALEIRHLMRRCQDRQDGIAGGGQWEHAANEFAFDGIAGGNERENADSETGIVVTDSLGDRSATEWVANSSGFSPGSGSHSIKSEPNDMDNGVEWDSSPPDLDSGSGSHDINRDPSDVDNYVERVANSPRFGSGFQPHGIKREVDDIYNDTDDEDEQEQPRKRLELTSSVSPTQGPEGS
jgi:hypothetical protein